MQDEQTRHETDTALEMEAKKARLKNHLLECQQLDQERLKNNLVNGIWNQDKRTGDSKIFKLYIDIFGQTETQNTFHSRCTDQQKYRSYITNIKCIDDRILSVISQHCYATTIHFIIVNPLNFSRPCEEAEIFI